MAQKINNTGACVLTDEPMARHTTFHIGGPADLYVAVRTASEFGRVTTLLKTSGVPVFILGGGANLLVSDKGIRGAVVDVEGLSDARLSGASVVAQAGIPIDRLAEEYLARGLADMENFYGMPGTLGGAIFMNARCYESDMAEVVQGFSLLTDEGGVEYFGNDPSLWSYKRSPFQEGGIYAGRYIVSARLKTSPGQPERIAATMRARRQDRMAKGHYRFPSAGSMFKNNRAFGKPTGAIIDCLGLRGMRIGDAQVAPWHGNLFINRGAATAGDMVRLINTVRDKVMQAYGFRLEPEVVFVGETTSEKV